MTREFSARVKYFMQPCSLLTLTSIDRLQHSQDTKIYYHINSIVPPPPVTTPIPLCIMSQRREEQLSGCNVVVM
jgi:hypothetical protein